MRRGGSDIQAHAAGDGSERGVVLLNALIVIAVVAAIAANLIRSDLDARNRYELMLRSDQARVYALAAEALAIELLALDAKSSEIDYLGESWAETDRTFDIEGAILTGRIYDLQGRLNINRVLQKPEQIETVTDSGIVLAEPEFNLLKSLIKNAKGPATLAPRMVEWMSNEVANLPGAAADAPYLKGETPFLRPAQAPLTPLEFRQVEGMSARVFAVLTTSLAALPGETSLNVNTAPGVVLQAMMPGLSPTLIKRLMRYRQSTPFQSRTDFENYVGKIIPPDNLKEIAALDLDVKSNWFLLEVEVTHGNSRAGLYSVILRPDGGDAPSVYLRSSSAL
jgi:general secretion pathway protein K